MSLEDSDAEAAAVAVAPRVSLAHIEEAIVERYDFNAMDVLHSRFGITPLGEPHPLEVLSLCIIVMRNGYTVVGKSAPASAANFDAEFGKKLAYEDAVRQIWPLMGFALRCKIHEETYGTLRER